jgi:hypothetical protein
VTNKLKWLLAIVLNSIKKEFLSTSNKEFDFSQIMRELKTGDYVYWLIAFDPRFENKTRELENAINTGVHFRILTLKADCQSVELGVKETNRFNQREFDENSKSFNISLEDLISRIDETIAGSLGVFIYNGPISLPFFIIIRKESKKIEVYNSPFLTEPISKIPYLYWETELKLFNQEMFELDRCNMSDLFIYNFEKRWNLEKVKCYGLENEIVDNKDFIYAPKLAKPRCLKLFNETEYPRP